MGHGDDRSYRKGRIVIRPYNVAVKEFRKLPSGAGEDFEIVTKKRWQTPGPLPGRMIPNYVTRPPVARHSRVVGNPDRVRYWTRNLSRWRVLNDQTDAYSNVSWIPDYSGMTGNLTRRQHRSASLFRKGYCPCAPMSDSLPVITSSRDQN